MTAEIRNCLPCSHTNKLIASSFVCLHDKPDLRVDVLIIDEPVVKMNGGVNDVSE